MKTGIYRIRNTITNDSYIGSAKNIIRRWQRHKSGLIHNKHENAHLQRAWNKYGGDNFVFEIVKECMFDDLLEIEQKYLDLKPEYNIGIISSGGDNLTNNPNRDDIIRRMKISLRETILNMSDDCRKTKYSRPMELNPNWKGGINIKYCKCGNVMSYSAKTCRKCSDKSGDGNSFFGKHHSNVTREALSNSMTGKYNGEQNISIIVNDIEYRSAGEASKVLCIPMATIRWRVMSKNNKFSNYKYK
jgi:group I intron endonuclease